MVVVEKIKICYIFGNFMISNVFSLRELDKKAKPAAKFGCEINRTNKNWKQFMTQINSSNDDRAVNHKTKKINAGTTSLKFLLISIFLALGVAEIGSVNNWKIIEDHLAIAIIWIIISFCVGYIVEGLRLSKLADKINDRYAKGGVIQGFAEDDQILQEYRTKISDNNIPIEIFKLYFNFVVCKTNSKSSWAIDRGDFDSEAYDIAYVPYEIELKQWESTAAIIKANEKIANNAIRNQNRNLPEASRGNEVYVNLPPKPRAPNRKDYVTYTEEVGSCESYLEHERFISAAVHELNSKNYGVVKINILEHESELNNVYRKVFEKIISGDCQVNDNKSVEIITPLTSNQLISRLNGDIESGLLSKVKGLMEYDDENPRIYNIETAIETNTFKFPVVFVLIGSKNKTWECELVDSLDPKIVIVERD